MNALKARNPLPHIIFFLLATSPLLFGARHPFIQGLYTFLILMTSGIWIVMHMDEMKSSFFKPITLPPVIILVFIFFTSLTLPEFLLKILSPVRADYLNKGSVIAQLSEPVTSLSYFAPGTQIYAVYLLSLFLYFFCSSRIFRTKDILITAMWIITGVGMLEAIYGLLQAMIPTLGVLWLPSIVSAEGSARGTIIYRNQYAAFMNMCWPVSISLGILLYKPVVDKILFRRRMNNKLTIAEKINTVFQKATIPFWGGLFMMLAVIFSRSRGGIIVMILISALLLFFLPFARKLKAVFAGIFLVLIAGYGGLIGFKNVIDRFFMFYEGAQARITLWIDSLSMLRDHLLTGIGMGSYKFLSPIYLQKVPDNVWYDFAHNEYIELLIELGLPMMLILMGWIIWAVVQMVTRIWHRKKESKAVTVIEIKDINLVAIGTFCTIIGFLLHALVDFTWRLPVNMIYFVTLLGILSASLSPENPDHE